MKKKNLQAPCVWVASPSQAAEDSQPRFKSPSGLVRSPPPKLAKRRLGPVGARALPAKQPRRRRLTSSEAVSVGLAARASPSPAGGLGSRGARHPSAHGCSAGPGRSAAAPPSLPPSPPCPEPRSFSGSARAAAAGDRAAALLAAAAGSMCVCVCVYACRGRKGALAQVATWCSRISFLELRGWLPSLNSKLVDCRIETWLLQHWVGFSLCLSGG